jgi:tol-pal system protein YbgF
MRVGCGGVERVSPAGNVEIFLVLAVLCLAPSVSACAHAKGPGPQFEVKQAALAAELDLLRQELDERAHLVTQLENRLSLLEAEQRQLRYELAQQKVAPAAPRETLRTSEHVSEREARPGRRSEARPVLRLYEDRRSSGEALAPVPQVSERLLVAPLPATLGAPPEAAPARTPDAYVLAIDLVRRRDFAGALSALDAFLAERPEDERATRALFWRGEVLFAQQRYAPALAAFQSALEREPRGEKAADALLKIVLCHRRLGAPERAREALERLKTQFPQSHAARLAQAEEA